MYIFIIDIISIYFINPRQKEKTRSHFIINFPFFASHLCRHKDGFDRGVIKIYKDLANERIRLSKD